MDCYSCKNVTWCPAFSTLCAISDNFCISNCIDYEEEQKYKYKKIAEHDDLMRLIYDYFTNQVEGDYSDEEVVTAITRAILNL